MRKLIYSSSLLILIFFLASCGEEEYQPKPRGYFRVSYSPHVYKSFTPDNCPFSFEIPKEAVVIPDTNALSEPCWYYLIFPKLNAQVYLTYKTINDKNPVRQLMEDTRTLVYKHTSRASSIDENIVAFNDHVFGVIYAIGGDAASPSQFFVTDSSKHFLRGALYFNAEPNSDSIAPSVAYMKEDIEHLLKSLKWK